MRFEDSLIEMFNEIEVPDELSPQNISKMLKAKTARSESETVKRNNQSVPNIAALRRTIIIRTAGAAAACAVFAVGMLAYNRTNNPPDIEPMPNFQGIPTSIDDYDGLHSVVTGLALEPTQTQQDDTGKPIPDAPNATDTGTKEPASATVTAGTTPAQTEMSAVDDFLSEADIAVSDEHYIYCVFGETVKIIDMDTLEIVTSFRHGLKLPVTLMLQDDLLILISEEDEENLAFDRNGTIIADNPEPDESVPADETDIYQSDDDEIIVSVDSNEFGTQSEREPLFTNGAAPPNKTASTVNTRYNVKVEVFDISDRGNPVRTMSYGQNGRYLAARRADGALYIVTAYSDYRVKPFGDSAELENYVPAYYIDGRRFFVEAGNVIIPSNAGNTDYIVVSAIYPEHAAVAVKAVLGAGKDVYVCENTLNITGFGAVTSFSLDRAEVISYIGSEADGGAPPDTERLTTDASNAAYLREFSQNEFVGLSPVKNENGLTVGLKLGMYGADNNGLMLNGVTFAQKETGIFSKALTNERALLIDAENSLVGVPVYYDNQFGTVNQYYVFVYDAQAGFTLKGVIEYVELDDSAVFERAAVSGEALYIIGNGRIVSARISDLKVINTKTY